MRKKILFIISNLETGGVSKAMTSLMNVIDRERYDVSLMILSPTGTFMELLPPDLRLITNPVWSALNSRLSGFSRLLKSGYYWLAIRHLIRLVVSRFSKAKAGVMIAHSMPALDEEFDAIVDFNGQQQLYYMVDKLKAKKKITFFHNDYKKWPYYYKSDKKYYGHVDKIFTVSQACLESLKSVFPEYIHKMEVMENISSVTLIYKLASTTPTPNIMDVQKFKILTVGHLCDRKGTHWAIEAAALLKKCGIEFHWYFLGKDTNPEFYSALIAKYELTDYITRLGTHANPYPFIKQADLIVHTAKFEGKSIALDEAKLLCKPIVVTNFSTVHDQFEDGVNASICEMDPESIANSIIELFKQENKRQKYINNLTNSLKDNSTEIEKIYLSID